MTEGKVTLAYEKFRERIEKQCSIVSLYATRDGGIKFVEVRLSSGHRAIICMGRFYTSAPKGAKVIYLSTEPIPFSTELKGIVWKSYSHFCHIGEKGIVVYTTSPYSESSVRSLSTPIEDIQGVVPTHEKGINRVIEPRRASEIVFEDADGYAMEEHDPILEMYSRDIKTDVVTGDAQDLKLGEEGEVLPVVQLRSILGSYDDEVKRVTEVYVAIDEERSKRTNTLTEDIEKRWSIAKEKYVQTISTLQSEQTSLVNSRVRLLDAYKLAPLSRGKIGEKLESLENAIQKVCEIRAVIFKTTMEELSFLTAMGE